MQTEGSASRFCVCLGLKSGLGFPPSAVWFDDRQFGFSVALSVVCVFSKCSACRTTVATSQQAAAVGVSMFTSPVTFSF